MSAIFTNDHGASLRLAGLALALLPGLLFGQAPVALKQEAFAVVDGNADWMARINDAIYSYSEIGFQEYKTIALITGELEKAGFTVQRGVAGMPTAYMATYGSGKPVLGMMSDFDGVPGTSQNPLAFPHTPLVEGAPGHGEGHNTHQPSLLGAALALKEVKDRHQLPGTIVVYGGPAEELLASRGYMVNAGLFEGVDAIIDVHIGTEFGTSYGLNNFANMSVEWTFKGTQAHGARPWQGKSALDAVELMNVGVNMMREHGFNPDDARIHYVIPNGGIQPNVVPGEARVWYYFRAKSPEIVRELYEWSQEIAEGAAMATRTGVSSRVFSGSWPVNGNRELAELVQENIELVGMPRWSEDDQVFARAFQKAMGAEVTGLPGEVTPLGSDRQGSSTSDAGDISWQVPYVRMYIPAKAEGALAGHHWSSAIGPATPVAHKGIAVGSKAIAAAMLDLMLDEEKLPAIQQDFARQLASWPKWESLIPPGSMPPIHLNVEEMGKYRELLAPYEYDPASSQTYLEFLGLDWPPAEPSLPVGRLSNEPREAAVTSSIDWQWQE